MENLDDLILDTTNIDEDSKLIHSKPINTVVLTKNRSSDHTTTRQNNNSKQNNPSSGQRNKKAKRLPWNTKVLRDRFTPQPYPVKLVDVCTSFNNLNAYNNQSRNILIFMRNNDWMNYLKLMAIKQYALNLKLEKTQNQNGKLMVLVTNMASDVAPYVELVSRHTTLKIAGIDNNVVSPETYFKLKNEAHIIIISIDILIDWFTRSYLTLKELILIIFTDASAAFHNESYKRFTSTYLTNNSAHQTNIISFGSLNLNSKTTHVHVAQQIAYLKGVFHTDHVETATDLIDIHNLFNGIEPRECIQICDSVDLSETISSNRFQICLLNQIKSTYTFMEDLMVDPPAGKSSEDNFSYIHNLCVRVLNECVYLLSEVGIWCLAKSLLPIICQLDKLSSFIENSNKNKMDVYGEMVKEGEEMPVLTDPDQRQELILQYTSTSLRSLRETCISQFLQLKNNSKKLTDTRKNSMHIDLFLNKLCTPKVKSLVELLRTHKKASDEFCCLIFVQNKQVATSLSLLLKKLAKEDPLLNFIYPNYVIGHGPSTSQPPPMQTDCEFNSNTDPAYENPSDSLKQEEILRKFYSGDINLLICTYEMETHITAPSCVNLIIRLNCNSLSDDKKPTASNDSAFNYFSYINNKSRAETKNASCYFFIETIHFDEFFREFIRCKQIERQFIKCFSKLLQRDRILREDGCELGDDKGVLSLENAIRVVNKYCIRLPSDALTQLTPRDVTIERKRTDGEIEFKCLIYLPINSGIHESIESDWMSGAKLAQQTAAYRACLILYKRKELNDMLEPITKEIFYRLNHRSDIDDEREWSQFSTYIHKHQQQLGNQNLSNQNIHQQISNYMSHRPGGNKRKQTYVKRVSPYLGSLQAISVQHPVYLYIFQCTLTTPLPNTNVQDIPETNQIMPDINKFGLISSKILLETSDFPIFTQNGEETVACKLVKSGVYLTPNQLKLIKSFHRFLFSNILRLEGLGAGPLPFLSNQASNEKRSSQNQGVLVSIFNEILNDENKVCSYDFNWDLMKMIENCTDRSLLRVPEYTRLVPQAGEDDEEDAENAQDEKALFKFSEENFRDSVVIPFYRNSDAAPQFYCMASIDKNLSPLSPFPISSTKINAVHFDTFHQYFAVKYGILITDITQPLLVVSHPSTRLNLLTPRYMNMKASVIQRTFHQPHQKCLANQPINERKISSKIFLVPELVNIHPFSATVLRRSMCLPSILYRLNSLLVVEDLRREIARSTGVGIPWFSESQKFHKLTFDWDRNKELEISDMPDVEIDVASIKQQKRHEDEVVQNTDANWNFEIDHWDESILKEQKEKENDLFKNFNGVKPIFELNFEPKNLRNFIVNNEKGWHDDESTFNGNPKTLFIDPSEMELFDEVVDFGDSDEEFAYKMPEKIDKQSQLNKSDHQNPNLNKSVSEHSSDHSDNEHNEFDKESDVKFQFTIDINKLKADMKKKSAKLLSKLSVNSNDCSLVKNLVKTDSTESTGKTGELPGVKNLIGETLGADLETALDLNSLGGNNKLLKMNRDGETQKHSSYFISKGDHENEEEFGVSDLNEWFDKIQIKVDFECNEGKIDEQSVIDNIRKKLSLPIKKSESEVIHCSKEPLVKNDSKFLKLSLPIGLENIEEFFQANPTSSFNTLVSDPCIPVTVSTGKTTTSFRNTEWSFDFKLDDTEKDNQIGPGPELLLQALTLANAADGFDLERLETVGDSFLKQAVTVYLFFAYPNVHEGKLSYLRSKQVSNYNLYKLGKRKCLQELIVSNKFEPLDSWLPPHYDSVVSINKAKQVNSASLMLSSLLSQEPVVEQSQVNTFDKYKEHILSDKAIADSVEAIIGAYLITSGPKAALQVMSWFGLKVLPKVKCEDGSEVLINIPEVPRPIINDPLKLDQMIDGFATFEACIGYKFKQPVYLLQAFTHASYVYNTLTDCYQRLEFLGDAILDYVITRHLYEDKKRHSPGELTDLRSALVNNNIFAHLAVKYEFYKYFKYLSPSLFTIIDNFVCNQKKRNDEFDLDEDFFDFPIDEDEEEEFHLMNDSDSQDDLLAKNDGKKEPLEHHHKPFLSTAQLHELEEMEVPKCLGDIFESVAGAIFLDSDKSFDTVWRVYYGLMKPHIDKFTATVPKSPIRELFELEPETAKFEKPERTIDGKIRVTVSIFGRGKFKGVGRNYRIAKNAAAKLALKYLRNNKF